MDQQYHRTRNYNMDPNQYSSPSFPTIQAQQAPTPETPNSSRPAKNHKCRFCDKYFTGRDVIRHESTHTKEKPYVCHCGKACSRLDNLDQHFSKIHPNDQELNQKTRNSLVLVRRARHSSRSQATSPATSSVTLDSSPNIPPPPPLPPQPNGHRYFTPPLPTYSPVHHGAPASGYPSIARRNTAGWDPRHYDGAQRYIVPPLEYREGSFQIPNGGQPSVRPSGGNSMNGMDRAPNRLLPSAIPPYNTPYYGGAAGRSETRFSLGVPFQAPQTPLNLPRPGFYGPPSMPYENEQMRQSGALFSSDPATVLSGIQQIMANADRAMRNADDVLGRTGGRYTGSEGWYG